MRPKLQLCIITITAISWAIFTYLANHNPNTSVAQPVNKATPAISNNQPAHDPSVTTQHTAISDTDKISSPGTMEQTNPGTNKPVTALTDAGDNSGPESAIEIDSVNGILKKLRHPDPGDRITAIQQLNKLDKEEAVHFLGKVLSHDEDAYVRREAAMALAHIGGKEALAALTVALGDADNTVRHQVIQALGKTEGDVIPLLGQVMFSDADPELQRQAIKLIAIQDNPAAQALLMAAAQHSDENIKQEALLWIRESENRATATEINNPTQKPVTRFTGDNQTPEAFRDLDPEGRIAAIQQLHGVDQKEAVQILNKVLSWDEDAHVRSEAITALTNIGGEEALAAMTTALGDKDTAVRSQVIQSLGNTGSNAIPILGQIILSDPNPELRRQAVDLLAAQDNPAARALLETATQDADESVRLKAKQLAHQ